MPKVNKQPVSKRKSDFINSFSRNLGIITLALKECKMTYNTYKKWLAEDNKFAEQCREVENIQGDFVENKLMELISEKNVTAIIFYLKCRRKEKWSDRQIVQVEGNIDHTMKQIVVNVVDNDTKQLMENSLKLIDIESKEINK